MLVAALRPFAAKGASFVRYQTPASGKLHGALLDKDKLVAHTELMQAIVSLKWPRLNANVMDCACIKLFDEFHGIWQLNDEQKGSWVKTVSLRCRTMVSLLMHQMKKNKKKWPEWVLDMGLEPPAADKEPEGETRECLSSSKSALPSLPEEFNFGLDKDLGVAWRIPI